MGALHPIRRSSIHYLDAPPPIHKGSIWHIARCAASLFPEPNALNGCAASHLRGLQNLTWMCHIPSSCSPELRYVTWMHCIPFTETPIRYQDALRPLHRSSHTLHGCAASHSRRLHPIHRSSNTLHGCAASHSQRLHPIHRSSDPLLGCGASHSQEL